MFKKKYLISALIVGGLSSFSYAEGLSRMQVIQTENKIKTYQQQGNYSAADNLIKYLIQKDPDNVILYLDLAKNQYSAGQVFDAEKTLNYVIRNKDLTVAPEKARENITAFYRQVKKVADNQRAGGTQSTKPATRVVKASAAAKSSTNKSSFNYGLNFSSGFNSNKNTVSEHPAATTTATKETSLFSSTSVYANLQSAKKRMGKQAFQLNHTMYGLVNSNYLNTKVLQVDTLVSYSLEPKFLTTSKWLNVHKYPISVSYFKDVDAGLITLGFKPSVDIFKDHRLGYDFSFNIKNSEADTESTAYSSDSYYYRFNKRFKMSIQPSLSSQLRYTNRRGLGTTPYNRVDGYITAAIVPFNNVTTSQSYTFKYTNFTKADRQEIQHAFKTKLGYKINKNFNVGGEFQYKRNSSDTANYVYNQAVFALNVGWRN